MRCRWKRLDYTIITRTWTTASHHSYSVTVVTLCEYGEPKCQNFILENVQFHVCKWGIKNPGHTPFQWWWSLLKIIPKSVVFQWNNRNDYIVPCIIRMPTRLNCCRRSESSMIIDFMNAMTLTASELYARNCFHLFTSQMVGNLTWTLQ